MPVKTQEQNNQAGTIWHDWARQQQRLPRTEKEEENGLKEDLTEMTVMAMNFWLCKFVIEIRHKDKTPHVVANMLWVAAFAQGGCSSRNKHSLFEQFKVTLDAHLIIVEIINLMLLVKSIKGWYVTKIYWLIQLLNSASAPYVVFYIGLLFALHNGAEHRNLRF